MTTVQSTPDTARRALRGGVIGNYVDQFDIFVPVIALAPAAATLYGPGAGATSIGLVFAATLLGRPIGAAVFGHLADRWGRSVTTQLTVAGVAVTTALIACVPSHQTLGGATILVVLALRFIGGVFIGGEYTSAVPLAMEWSRPEGRGLLSGLIMSMSPWANASIAALTLLGQLTLGPEAYAAWGWRVIFGLGAAMAAGMAVYYRRRVRDTPQFRSAIKRTSPVRDILLGPHRRALLQVFVLMTGLWLFTNLAIAALTPQLSAAGTLAASQVSAVMLVATAVSAVTMTFCGQLATWTGRRPFFIAFGVLSLVAAPAAYLLTHRLLGTGLAAGVGLAVALLQVVTVSVYGPVGAYLAERFPVEVRASGYGVGYSLAMVLPALYPFYLPTLQVVLGQTTAVALLLGLGGLLIAAGAAAGPETYRGQRL